MRRNLPSRSVCAARVTNERVRVTLASHLCERKGGGACGSLQLVGQFSPLIISQACNCQRGVYSSVFPMIKFYIRMIARLTSGRRRASYLAFDLSERAGDLPRSSLALALFTPSKHALQLTLLAQSPTATTVGRCGSICIHCAMRRRRSSSSSISCLAAATGESADAQSAACDFEWRKWFPTRGGEREGY